jgi:hypothetical protein
VADYPAWKIVFDTAADIRREAGERGFQVLKYDNDPNRIVHFSTCTSHADAGRSSSRRVWSRSAGSPA